MRIFSSLYQRVLVWSKHTHAPKFLVGLSFAESSFFPIPPDVMLAPMVLARPHQAWWLATITMVASVLGGILGFLIGYYFLSIVEPYMIHWGYASVYATAVHWFSMWGFWTVLIAGFSPIPYKFFAIAAGALGMPIIPFIIASCIGRGSRFYLVAILLAWGGRYIERYLYRAIDWLGWITVIAGVTVGLIWYYWG